jgi:hypothetical protein
MRLLAAGADPNSSMAMQIPSGEVVQSTALCVAVARGRLEVVRLLLEAGADPSLAASDGETPLMIALGVHDQLEVLRLLLEWGAAVDAVKPATCSTLSGNLFPFGGTAFHSACFSNQPDCVEALVQAGCDVGIKDQCGETGREIAARRGHAAVVARLRAVVSEQLQAAQAAARAVPPEPEPAAAAGPAGAGSPAWQLCEAAEEGDAAAVVRLLAAGVDPNASAAMEGLSGEVLGEVSAITRTSHCT